MSSRSGGRMADGDWLCPDTKCGNLNFARRTHCNKCGKEQNKGSDNRKLLGTEIGKAAAEKSHGLFSAEDWQCNKCGNVNWARRGTCNMCNAPKIGELEERTGYGGGFNERQNVEYVARAESDDEFDDFGRRKKKFKGPTKSSQSSSGSSRHSSNSDRKSPVKSKPAQQEEEDSDDEEDGDLSKYALWSDDDEDVLPNNKSDKGSNDRNGRKKDRSYSRSHSRSRSPRRDRSRSRSSSSRKRRNSRSRSPYSRSRRSRSRSADGGSGSYRRGRRDRRYSSSRSRSRSPRRRYSRK